MRRILIVDDEEDFRRIVRQVLEIGGYGVETAGSAEEGLKRLEQAPPDLAIVDWNLPGASGVEFCRRVRAEPRWSGIPLVMLTVRGQAEDQLAAFQEGQADLFLVKPVPPEELLARVERVLGLAGRQR